MRTSTEDAQNDAATALYKLIETTVAEVAAQSNLAFRVPNLKELADAYAAVTFGIRSK